MKEGLVLQYAPPLEVYKAPANQFSAEFVGNPTINFVDVECLSAGPEGVQLASDDLLFTFKPSSPLSALAEGQRLLLGIRPESISLSEEAPVRGRIYSALPSGMETTVMLKLKNILLTSVVFGGQDYPVDGEIGLELVNESYILFDKNSEENIASGLLKMSLRDAP